ncbi:hypothetical protein CVT24_010595 [Panaeolus cyanescens]|uniref:Uncharacterized protein n=1 Tax=Panaeolus cyanescens TaxID=181874 RepID=A0A409YM91_9AGAR|nr:hypothetical protein CVT24_010595 [Panaeolus cyanescens]
MANSPHLENNSETTKSTTDPRFPPLRVDASTKQNVNPFASILDSTAPHPRSDDSDAHSIAMSFSTQDILNNITDIGMKTRRSCRDAIEIISDVDRELQSLKNHGVDHFRNICASFISATDNSFQLMIRLSHMMRRIDQYVIINRSYSRDDVSVASTIPTAEREALYKLIDGMRISLANYGRRHLKIAKEQKALIGDWRSFIREGGSPPSKVDTDCDDTARIVACIEAHVLHKRGSVSPTPKVVGTLQDMITTSRLSYDCIDIEAYFTVINECLDSLQIQISSWKPMEWRSHLVVVTNRLVPYISVVSSLVIKLSFNHYLLLRG